MEAFGIEGKYIFILIEAILLGGFLGLQREMIAQKKVQEKSFMGLRTMSMLGLLGAISTFFPEIPMLPIIFFGIIGILVAIAYAHGSFQENKIGMTAEFSALLTFWIGVLVGKNQIILAILITIFLAAINTYRESLHNFAKTLKEKEWQGAFQLLLFSGAVLPFLPKETIDPLGVFNPFKIWLLVLIISGMGFVGYFLIKYLGSKGGIPIMSFLGAITSSTATTIALSEKSKNWGMANLLASGIMIAQSVMLLRIIGILYFLGETKTNIYIPLTIMSITGFGWAFYFFLKKETKQTTENFEQKNIQSPFQIMPAIKFGIFFTGILFAITLGKIYFGETGVYITAFFSGIIDVDATILSSLEAIKNQTLSLKTAETAIILTIIMNTLIKIGYTGFLGTKTLTKKIAIAITSVTIVGGISFLGS